MYASSISRNLFFSTLNTYSIAAVIRRYGSQPERHSLVARQACNNGFQGNDDLYGLGIRIGIYLQWISSLLTNVLLPTGTSDYLDTNSIFLFAVFIATAYATHRDGGLRPAEAFIMLQLCYGFLLSVLSVSGFRLTLLRDKVNLDPALLSSKLGRNPAISQRLPR